MKLLASEIDIGASAETVWSVHTDFESYSEWNPVEIEMKGRPIAGTTLEHTAKLPGRKPMRFRPTIVEVEPGEVLAWKGRVLIQGVFDVLHRFSLAALSENRTRLRQEERLSGLLIPFSRRTLRAIQEAFRVANRAIKARVEGIAGNTASQDVSE